MKIQKLIDNFVSKPMFYKGIRNLAERWQKIIENEGRYFAMTKYYYI